MFQNQHTFHIPVMGTGHSIDTPIRVAHLGIHSVISVVDDLLCEKIRKHYCSEFDLAYKNIPRSAVDGRAERIKAYLETVHEIVTRKFQEIKELPLFEGNEKDRYFNLLPGSNPLKSAYQFIEHLSDREMRERLIEDLNNKMRPGSIDVNIMAKVDALGTDKDDQPLSSEYSDASAALRGYANSSLSSSLVLSAGFNPRLYSYISDFKDFYRDTSGEIKKKVILKVSDFRSALIQGKFLAKKGIEVAEFRIESGLNCGGHAFASDGSLLPVLLEEFREKRDQLRETFLPMVQSFYEAQGWEYPEVSDEQQSPRITVQGGIGTNGEMERLLTEYGMDATGWGSPFLLVPEATCVDDFTSQLLANAAEKDLYLSGVSPLGVPFNNIRGSGSAIHTEELIKKGKPGSKCPKGFLVSNTEFTENPICTASAEYQILKINSIDESADTEEEKERQKNKVMEKTCLCTNLGTGSLIRLGIMKPTYGRQAICPGPNIAWFNREYSLDEMVNHIYGRGESLVPEERPHMFAKELVMYVDYISELSLLTDPGDAEWKKLVRMQKNLEKGMDLCMEIAESEAYEGENLESLRLTVEKQRMRLADIFQNNLVL
ncbi:hypothetical protein DYD21_13445 [Rhodohalobacter sp. SW132]|uniref:hypothetical protein n=1 Tax=Rhodohalobacter sp. SW132 TaxID=2293433 RepID=UPI000E25319A|nr:hypothetical protein [Rhodohalobacter sp. SW132]REL32826.1 hypothetical protein DYD21_13445 [Rhodohalobacter sp. SW132]